MITTPIIDALRFDAHAAPPPSYEPPHALPPHSLNHAAVAFGGDSGDPCGASSWQEQVVGTTDVSDKRCGGKRCGGGG